MGYQKSDNSIFMTSGCRLFRCNMMCYSSTQHAHPMPLTLSWSTQAVSCHHFFPTFSSPVTYHPVCFTSPHQPPLLITCTLLPHLSLHCNHLPTVPPFFGSKLPFESNYHSLLLPPLYHLQPLSPSLPLSLRLNPINPLLNWIHLSFASSCSTPPPHLFI